MRTILCVFLISSGLNSYCQIIWSEDFSTGSAARGTSAVGYPGSSGGTWGQTITGPEGGSANQWYVSGEECGNAVGTCGTACSNGDASLHVSAIGGLCGTPDCGAAYDETSAANATDRRIESPLINTTGYGTLTLDFGYIAAQGDDGFRVEYSCDGGASWNILSTPAATQCCSCLDAFICGFIGLCCPPQTQQSCASGGQGFWTNASIALPVCAENIPNLRIGFHWANDGNGVGIDPSVAIDDITITSAMPLPVELVGITANETRDGNQIEWKTLSETNCSHFEIEHHEGDGLFFPIGAVSGQGTTQETTLYNWTHKDASDGENYYRLKQIDFDGTASYSQTLLVRNNHVSENSLFIFPNPAQKELNIRYNAAASGFVNISILDVFGRTVLRHEQLFQLGTNECVVDISRVEVGHYFITIEADGKRTTQPFVRQ